MANRKTIADILAGYEVAKSIISNLNQEAYLNALVAGLNLGVDRRVGEPIVRRGPCMESVQSNDHRGSAHNSIAIRLSNAPCAIASAASAEITQSKVTKPIVKRFLRKKGQICPAKDDINDRVHNSSAIHCKECSEKNRAEIRDWKNKCICLAKRDSMWIRAWCDTEGFIRLEAEVNATLKWLYNTHRQRVRKKGNRNHTFETVLKAEPQRAWRACPIPGCGIQLSSKGKPK